MLSYSQLEQDLEVIKFYNNKKNGYFIEIGASDGIKLSNTYLLETKFDWTGICVEPLPNKIDALKKNRPNSICINKAVYSTSGLYIPFSISNENDLLSGISDYITCFKKVVNSNKKDINVETITLNDILEQNNSPLIIDYLSLDTEGTEFEILKSINFNKYMFGIMHIEHNYIEPLRTNIKEFLESNNYIFYKDNQFDDIYIHKTYLV